MDEGTVAFYVTTAAAAAGMFGLGAGLLASRVIGLAERASSIARERVDVSTEVGTRFGDSWRDRHRLSELAAIHHLARRIRNLIAVSLSFTGTVVAVALLVVAGHLLDSSRLRVLLLISIVAASIVWVATLFALANRTARFTAPYVTERRRRRENEGSGVFSPHFDAEDLDTAIDRLVRPVGEHSRMERLRARLAGWRWKKGGSVDTP